jgi:hypothetical protein
MNINSLNVLLNKIKSKEKNSRQYNILVERLKKCFKKELKFRDIRNFEKSKEIAQDFFSKKEEDILNSIKKTKLKNIFNQEKVK